MWSPCGVERVKILQLAVESIIYRDYRTTELHWDQSKRTSLKGQDGFIENLSKEITPGLLASKLLHVNFF